MSAVANVLKIAALGCAACGLTAPLAAPLAAQDENAAAPEQAQEPASGVGSFAWHSEQQSYLAALKRADGWHFVEGGLRWRWLEYNGSQTRPSVSDSVTAHYEGKLIDGTVFDSSYARGEPATFPLSGLIRGWQLAIPKMGLGETIEIAIPADLAYGPVGRGPIPGGATLVFKVELVSIAGK